LKKIKKIRTDWVKLPLRLFTEYGVSPTEACVWALLADMDCIDTDDYYKSPSITYIAETLGISTRTAIRAVKALEEKGVIFTDRKAGARTLYHTLPLIKPKGE